MRLPRLLLGSSFCAVIASLQAQPANARLVDISTNGQVGGFLMSGGPKTVLIRAIGPGLAAFGGARHADRSVSNPLLQRQQSHRHG